MRAFDNMSQRDVCSEKKGYTSINSINTHTYCAVLMITKVPQWDEGVDRCWQLLAVIRL